MNGTPILLGQAVFKHRVVADLDVASYAANLQPSCEMAAAHERMLATTLKVSRLAQGCIRVLA